MAGCVLITWGTGFTGVSHLADELLRQGYMACCRRSPVMHAEPETRSTVFPIQKVFPRDRVAAAAFGRGRGRKLYEWLRESMKLRSYPVTCFDRETYTAAGLEAR